MKNIVLLSILMLFSLALFSKEVVANPYEQSAFVIDDIEVWITRPSYKSNNCNIFILAHSMGFAYSLGMVSYHRDKIEPDQNGHRFGRFYILAPENACSAPTFPISDFEEIWQYGTVESTEPNPHKKYENDGVAPQCGIPGLTWTSSVYGRVPFQGLKEHLNFVDAHLAGNYKWIFYFVNQKRGYVRARY